MKELRRQLKELLQQAGAAVFERPGFYERRGAKTILVAEKDVLRSLRRKEDKKKPEQTWQSYC